MIQSGAPISHNLALLEQSKGAIRIQDVLSYFPEFTKIEHFKEPLLASLKEYSSEIKVLFKNLISRHIYLYLAFAKGNSRCNRNGRGIAG